MLGSSRRTPRGCGVGSTWRLLVLALLLLIGLASVTRAQLTCDENGVCVYESEEEQQQPQQAADLAPSPEEQPSALEPQAEEEPEPAWQQQEGSEGVAGEGKEGEQGGAAAGVCEQGPLPDEEPAVEEASPPEQEVKKETAPPVVMRLEKKEVQERPAEHAATVEPQSAPDGRVELKNPPRTVKLGHVLDNLADKVPPELPQRVVQTAGHGQALVTRAVSRLSALLAPHVNQFYKYGSELGLRPPTADLEGLMRECEAGGSSGGATACHILHVSSSLWSQLSTAGKNASSSAHAWLSREVPEVSIPFHLLWVEVDVDVSPLSTASDVKAILLKQRPFAVVRLLDRVSSVLVRLCHAVPPLDYLINARYDLFYWPDPACPLEPTAEGVLARAPLTADGYCVIRPCEAQASLPGQQGSSPYCECDLPQRQCRVRADALRSFALAVDGPLASKPFNAHCSTRVVPASVPHWLPPQIKPWLSRVPASVLSLCGGVALALLAEPLSESGLVHLLVSALLGLFSLLILLAVLLNQVLKTVRSMQQLSTVTTVLSSVAVFLALQRFAAVSPTQQALTLLQLAWSDYPVGRSVLVGAACLGIGLKSWFGWFNEPEDEAVGVLGRLLNGRMWLRRTVQLASLSLLLHAAPNPDWAALLALLFLGSSTITYWLYRAHMALHASPDVSRYVQQPGASSVDEVTRRELQKLREAMQQQPDLLNNLSEKTRFRAGEFRDGRDHILPADVEGHDDMFGGARGRGGWGCAVQ